MVLLNREFLIDEYGIEKLEELTKIDLTNRQISKIDSNTFDGLNKLENLYLDFNEIEEIDGKLFDNLLNLKELQLSNNKLERIDLNTFKSLSKLETLSLIYNKIKDIDQRLFESLSNLKVLRLYNNKLKRIDSGTLKSLTNLEELNLSNNEIEEVDKKLVESLSNLRELKLSYNKIKSFDPYTFKGLINLNILSLANNGIEEVDSILLEDLSNLKELYISNNKLKRIDLNAFKNLTKLERLILYNNEIKTIDGLFESLKNLKSLWILNNKLERLDFSAFKNLTKLYDLRLNNNSIEYIDVRLFENLSSLKVLRLDGNKLREIDRKCFAPLKSIEVIELYENESLKALSFVKSSTNRNYDKASVKKYGFLSDWNEFLQQFSDLEILKDKELIEEVKEQEQNESFLSNQSLKEESKIKDQYIGKLINDQFKVVKKLGRGSFGYVYLVDDINVNESKQKAMKIMDQLDWVTENELEMLFHINHENILRYFEHFHLKIGDENKTFLITEYCENGDLKNRIEDIKKQPNTNFSDKQLLKWMIQTTKALKYLHSKQPTPIIHRDIKPANMLLTVKDEIKLTDLGVAKLMENSVASTFAGTPTYMSPEVFKSLVLEINYYPNTDIWSLGCVVYELIFLRLAFPRGQRGDPPIPSDLSSSVLFSSVLYKMLEKDCSKRISSEALLSILEKLIEN